MSQTPSNSAREIADTIADGCLSSRIRFLNRTVNAIYDDAYRGLGITASQGNMLVAIVSLGEVSPTRLGQVLNIEKSTLSRNLDRMQQAGLIDIFEPGSGRTLSLRATKTGRDLMADMLPLWKEAQKATCDLLGKEGSREVRDAVDHAREKIVPS